MKLWGVLAGVAFCCVMALGVGVAGAASESVGGPDPAVSEWPEWPHPVACGYGTPFDPVAAFSGPTNAERGAKPSEKALAQYLREGELDWVRKHQWRLVTDTANRAEFASGRLIPGPEWMTFESQGGVWKWSGYSSRCEPASLRRGRPAITWTLAKGVHLTPKTTTIEINLGPGECSGGRSQNDRLQKPEFREQQGTLMMTLWLKPLPPGIYTCPGLIEPAVKIRLPGPLGKRPLMDGGTYPPRFPNPAERGER